MHILYKTLSDLIVELSPKVQELSCIMGSYSAKHVVTYKQVICSQKTQNLLILPNSFPQRLASKYILK